MNILRVLLLQGVLSFPKIYDLTGDEYVYCWNNLDQLIARRLVGRKSDITRQYQYVYFLTDKGRNMAQHLPPWDKPIQKELL